MCGLLFIGLALEVHVGPLSPIFRPDWSEWAVTLFWYGRAVLELYRVCCSQQRQSAFWTRDSRHDIILHSVNIYMQPKNTLSVEPTIKW